MTEPPLLAIAAGRRARPRKAPQVRPKESALQIAIIGAQRDYGRPDWLFWHTANGELRDKRAAAKLKAMGVRPGVPDLLFLSPAGIAHFVECKRPGGRLSDEQEKFREHCIRHGIAHVVVESIDQALAALDHWGALRIKIAGGAK